MAKGKEKPKKEVKKPKGGKKQQPKAKPANYGNRTVII